MSNLVILTQWRKSILVANWSKYNLMKRKFSFFAKMQRPIKAEDQMISHLFSLRKHVYRLHIFISDFQKNPSNGYLLSSLEDSHSCAPLRKGDKSQVSKYRSSFPLGYCRKFFEAIAFKRVYDHSSTLFSKSQFGCRKNRSTMLQLITFLRKLYRGIGTNNDIDVIFTDFSKAFEKVDHLILLHRHYGI